MFKRFMEFATQNTDNGEINNGFHDIKTGEWYYTKDSENAKKICELLNELNNQAEAVREELRLCEEENNELQKENEQLKTVINRYEKYYNKKNDELNFRQLDILKLKEENEQLKQSYKEFEDECQSTFNAMNRKQNDLYRKNFKLKEENEQLKQQLFETSKELLWATSDEVDRALHYEDEVEELRKEIFE